jgi:hypothetical protein
MGLGRSGRLRKARPTNKERGSGSAGSAGQTARRQRRRGTGSTPRRRLEPDSGARAHARHPRPGNGSPSAPQTDVRACPSGRPAFRLMQVAGRTDRRSIRRNGVAGRAKRGNQGQRRQRGSGLDPLGEELDHATVIVARGMNRVGAVRPACASGRTASSPKVSTSAQPPSATARRSLSRRRADGVGSRSRECIAGGRFLRASQARQALKASLSAVRSSLRPMKTSVFVRASRPHSRSNLASKSICTPWKTRRLFVPFTLSTPFIR